MTAISIGDVFGAWQVLEDLGVKCKCLCTACGVTTKGVRKSDLLNNKSRMCKKCSQSTDSQPIEYHSWVSMLQRCYNPNCKDYPNYGGRGIQVHEVWRDSFAAFYMYMGPRPAPDYTIERIDTNGNYVPGNVCWATRAEQTRNQRSNVKLTIRGETKTVTEWVEHPDCTVTCFTVYKRLNRGWDAERAVFTPSKRG